MIFGQKRPFIFNATVGTTKQRIAAWEFDSIFIANDSANDVYYSVTGESGPYQKIRTSETHTFDKCTESMEFWAYASGAGSAIRVTLWAQKGRGE